MEVIEKSQKASGDPQDAQFCADDLPSTSEQIVDARAVCGPAKGILDDARKPIFETGFASNFVSNCYTVCIPLYVHLANSCKMRRLQPIMAAALQNLPEDS